MTVSSLVDEVSTVFVFLAESYAALPLPVQLLVVCTFGLFLFFGSVRLFL